MKVLVTGCAGFIGSHITDALLKAGHSVIGVDNFVTGRAENLPAHKNFKFIEADVRSDYFESILAFEIACSTPVTHICHQAALGSVPRSLADPTTTIDNNVMGFLKVLEAARAYGVKRVVYASSSSIYNPTSPYALSKRMNEDTAAAYNSTFELECIGLRYFNVFGPRQRPDGPYAAVIPKFIDAIQNDRPIVIYGDGTQCRDFTFVTNVVRANLLALENVKDPETHPLSKHSWIYDIGCGRQTEIRDVARLIANKLGKPCTTEWAPARKGEALYSKELGNAHVYQLKYKPEVEFEDGLDQMLNPLADHQAPYNHAV